MEKVTLTKAQAEVFEKWKEEDLEPHILVSTHVHHANNWTWGAITGMPLDTFIKAAYGFYEVEKTPNEIIKQHVDEEKLMSRSPYRSGWLDGVSFALTVLGIKIEGVNDTDGGSN